MAGANPARCTERTLSGSKAAKSAQGTDHALLGARSRTPEDPLARSGSATSGPTARRHGASEELVQLRKRGTPCRAKPKGVCGVKQTRGAEGGASREEVEKT